MVKNIGIATNHFYNSFRNIIPDIKHIKRLQEISLYDLIIFSGGGDISPILYGRKEVSSSYGISPTRDATEIAILNVALKYPNIKILGVCRGHQLINAYLGGNLVEDLSELANKIHGIVSNHELEILNNKSIIATYFSLVNSMHHQAVIEPGQGLKVTSKVGEVIESTESDNILTVQFHPEFMDGTEEFWKFITNDWLE